jgi:hypothetical protein
LPPPYTPPSAIQPEQQAERESQSQSQSYDRPAPAFLALLGFDAPALLDYSPFTTTHHSPLTSHHSPPAIHRLPATLPPTSLLLEGFSASAPHYSTAALPHATATATTTTTVPNGTPSAAPTPACNGAPFSLHMLHLHCSRRRPGPKPFQPRSTVTPRSLPSRPSLARLDYPPPTSHPSMSFPSTHVSHVPCSYPVPSTQHPATYPVPAPNL